VEGNSKAEKRAYVASRVWSITVWLVAVGAFLWFANVVSRGETATFDEAFRSFIHSYSSPLLTQALMIVSFTGKVAFLLCLGTIVTIFFIYFRRYRWLIVFLSTMAGEIVLELSLKAAYLRARPGPYFGLPAAESFSFPSGHALGSICFYGILAWLFLEKMTACWVRVAVTVGVILWIVLIGFSRIYLGFHYPSDVAAGFFVGMIWTSAVIAMDRLIGRRFTKKAA
jgi:undecaprenyl-diphosphatase